MKILDDLLSTLDTEVTVRDIRQGLFHTGVLTRSCGLAATLPRDALRQERPSVKEPGLLLKKSALELAWMAYSESILEAAIGMATINSLVEVDEQRCASLNAADLIAAKGRDKKVAIVGHFPFTPRLRNTVKELWVIEKNPREGDFTEAEGENLIPQADVVGITGTAFTNHTIEQLLKLCAEAYVVVLGDTAPLSPVLFDYGIDAISGTKVVDPDLALRCVSEGATYRQIEGILKLTMTAGGKETL
ncbi:Rossmann-like domain-containing protein [Chloroflexota bacterium]